jgi:RNA polymerase sigma factor (sigma-70 family)
MTSGGADSPLGPFEVLWGSGSFAGWSDGELLARFLAGRDPVAEAAFAALVSRHGPMVLKVCRQLVGDEHIVEDAFQATFIVLARKARAIRHPEALSRWLYGVAVRAARKARAIEERQARRARRLDPEELDEAVGDDRPLDLGLIRRETSELLHRELGRLPERYRAPVILCHLEGLTHQEAARRLGWPVGTVGVRLMRGRELLRQRLIRRGVAPAAAVSAALWSDSATAAAVTTGLVEATTRSVMHIVVGRGPAASATAASLTKEVLRGLALARLRAGVSLLAAVVVGVAAGVTGAYWLSPDPERELDARALQLALRLRPVAKARSSPLSASAAPARSRDWLPNGDPQYSPAQGYEWVSFNDNLLPLSIRQDKNWSEYIGNYFGVKPDISGTAHIDQAESGEIVLTIGRSLPAECERILDCRPVLFDAGKRRYLPTPERRTHSTSESGARVVIDRFRLGRDVLALEAITVVGVERMKPETRRLAVGSKDTAPFHITSPSPDTFSRDRREASPDRSWILAPRPVGQGDWTTAVSGPDGGVACDVSKTRTGVLAVHLAYRSSTSLHGSVRYAEEYRPVLFDAKGNRHVLDSEGRLAVSSFSPLRTGSPIDWNDTAVCRFEVQPDLWRSTSRDRFSGEDVVLIGVERLSQKSLRDGRRALFMAFIEKQYHFMDMKDKQQRSHPSYNIINSPFGPTYPGSFLGAYEILRTERGQPSTTPEALRAARIALFLRMIEKLEHQWGARFANMVETPLLDAYEIVRRQSGAPK